MVNARNIKSDLIFAVEAVRFDGDYVPMAALFLKTGMLMRAAAAILSEAEAGDRHETFAALNREVLEVFQDHAVPEYENHSEAWAVDAMVGTLEAGLRPGLIRLLAELETP